MVSFVFVCCVLVILGGLDQVVDVNVEIVVVFDVVDRGLGRDLVDDQPGSLHSFVSNIFNLLTHKALCLLARLPVSRQQVLVLWGTNGEEKNKKQQTHTEQIQSFFFFLKSQITYYQTLKANTRGVQ